MPPVIPDPKKIKSFRTAEAFEKWLSMHHARETEVWLKVHKKDSGLPSVTHAQALEVALCWRWIDAIRKSFDGRSFLQRFTPRKAKSIWSQINRDHIARLTAAGRMTPHGQRARNPDLSDTREDEPVCPWVPHKHHEDARGTRKEDRRAGRHARARRDDRPREGAPRPATAGPASAAARSPTRTCAPSRDRGSRVGKRTGHPRRAGNSPAPD